MPFIKVSFYKKIHQNKLKNTHKYQAILELVQKRLYCSNEDLWTYALLKEQKPFPGFNSYE
ncbi:hypothetical protein NIES25_66520 (plasmid) [Nostoc linckia NIES-25]|nr:hypothetical protein NIES25_66520 [Nostoc linckia NIES-25]